MKKVNITVLDMMCQHCRKRIDEGLKNAGIEAEVTLENKTVTLDDTDVPKARKVIAELGFQVK